MDECEDDDCECCCHQERQSTYSGPPHSKEEMDLVFMEPVAEPLTAILIGKLSRAAASSHE